MRICHGVLPGARHAHRVRIVNVYERRSIRPVWRAKVGNAAMVAPYAELIAQSEASAAQDRRWSP